MSSNNTGYNVAVSVSRVLAMFMIIICHIGSATGNSAIGQLFQTGVQVFLFISGYLYSNKDINNTNRWLWGRFVKICIPCYLFILGAAAVNTFLGNHFSWVMLILGVFNLEGYHHIFNKMYYIPAIPGTAHLWFITALMICYLLTIFVKRKPVSLKYLMIFLSVGIVLGFFGIRLDYFWIYFVGYLYGKSCKKISGKKYALVCLAAIGAGILRMIVKGYCDINGENNFYLFVVIPFVYNVLAIWIFTTIELLVNIRIISEVIVNTPISKVIVWIDGISFYVFITHYIFIDEPLRILGLTQYSFLNAILLTIAIISVSILLKKISSDIGKKIYIRLGG